MQVRALRRVVTALAVVAGVVVIAVSATMTTLVHLAATALIMGGTGMKELGAPHEWGAGTYLEQVNDTYLSGHHLRPEDLAWVSTPEHFWPVTGLTDLSFDASVTRGAVNLHEMVMAVPGQKIVVGYSQSATIASREKRALAVLSAQGAAVPAPDELSFVLVGNPNRPNGGILARFPGLYIPIVGVNFDGATPNDDYPTIDASREYDLMADFPAYPLNLLADVNALLGYVYLHPDYGSSVIDLDDPDTYQSHTTGNTTYYLVRTEHLPLLQPLRDIGVPAPLLDRVEPALRALVDLGYDRDPEHMGLPTPARLFPRPQAKPKTPATADQAAAVAAAKNPDAADDDDATTRTAEADDPAPARTTKTPHRPHRNHRLEAHSEDTVRAHPPRKPRHRTDDTAPPARAEKNSDDTKTTARQHRSRHSHHARHADVSAHRAPTANRN